MEIKHSDSQDIKSAINTIFDFIGEDKDREGILDTPKRMVKMWKETLKGYDETKRPNITTFKNGNDGIHYNQTVIDTGQYYSYCEHHFLPFFGKYYFGYIPSEKGLILGLSKVARVVEFYSSRLQIQERLTSDIVNCLWEALCDGKNKPKGMILIMKGEHLCKSMRGVKQKGEMATTFTKGEFDKIEIRNEFISLIKLTE